MLVPLTSFRFFAALSVALYHLPYVLPTTYSGESFKYGYLGVNFFFILSGFIIHFSYGQADLNVKTFMIKRAARLLPVYYLTLIVWIALYFDSWGNSLTEKLNSGVATITLTQSYYNGLLFNLGYNAVAWSISVEVFFYLLYPLMRRKNIYLYVLLLGSVLALFSRHSTLISFKEIWPNFFYFNPLGRIFEFCLGILICNLHTRYKTQFTRGTYLQFFSLLLLLPSLIMIPRINDTQTINWLLSFPLGFFILAFSFPGQLQRVFNSRFLKFLGEASFCFYLIHHMAFRLLDTHLALINVSVGLRIVIALLIVTSLAAILHTYFELPVRKRIVSRYTS